MNKLYQKAKINIDRDSINEENGSLWGIFSTEDEDRHGDIVRQNWDLKNFKKNPVVINSHQYEDATEVIGKVEDIKTTKEKQLEGKIKFAVEQNPKAKIIFDLYSGGFLNTFSVGFLPKKFSDKGEILESELLELSTVSVPSNAMALAKRKGIDVNYLIDQKKTEEKDIEQEKKEEEDTEKPKEEEPKEELKENPKEEPEKEQEEPEEELEKEPEEENKSNKQEKIVNLINRVCEKVQNETRSKNDRAEKKRLINKAIRKLVKSKSRL